MDSIWDLGNEAAPADKESKDSDLSHFIKYIGNSLGRGLSTSAPYVADVIQNLATPQGQVGSGMHDQGGTGNPVGAAEALKGRGAETQDVDKKYSQIAGNPTPRSKLEERAGAVAQGVGSAIVPGQGIWGLGKAAIAGAIGGASAQTAHELLPNSEWAPVIAGFAGGIAGGVGAHSIGRGSSPVARGMAHPDYHAAVNVVIPGLEGGGTLDNPKTNSASGATGIMQVTPETARDPGYGIKPWNGETQEDLARVGREKYAAMLDKYNGDHEKALAAYNWGEGNVDNATAHAAKHGGTWFDYAPAETQHYVMTGMMKLGRGGSTGGSVAPMHPDDIARAMGEPLADAEPASKTEGPVDSGEVIHASDNVTSMDEHIANKVQDEFNATRLSRKQSDAADFYWQSRDMQDKVQEAGPGHLNSEDLVNLRRDLQAELLRMPYDGTHPEVFSTYQDAAKVIDETIAANGDKPPYPPARAHTDTGVPGRDINEPANDTSGQDAADREGVYGFGGDSGGQPPKEPPFGGGGDEPPSGGGEPPHQSPEEDKYAGSINLNRMEISNAAKENIRRMAAPMNANIETFNETRQKAQELLDSKGVEGVLNINEVKPEDLAHYSLAVRAAHAAAQEHMIRLNEEFLDPSRNSDVAHYRWQHARDILATAFERNQNIAKGLGRGLGSMRIEVGGTEGNLGDKLSDLMKSKATDEEIAKMIQEHPDQAGKIARDSKKPGASEYIFTVWYNLLLSSLKTLARNIASNTAHLTWDNAIVHPLAAVFGKLHDGEKVTFHEAGARLNGAIHGVIDGFKNAPEAYRAGTPSDFAERTQSYWKIPNRGIGRIAGAPTRILSAQDEVFLAIGQNAEYYGLAHRQAFKEGLQPGTPEYDAQVAHYLENPTKSMEKSAVKYGQMMRFQDPMEFKGLEYATRSTPKDPLMIKIMKGFLRILFPFPRNSDRMFFGAMRNSPLGVLEPQNIRDFKVGGAKRDIAMARVFAGTALTGALYAWAANGGITGGGPTDPTKKAQWLKNHQSYSFNFPGGVHVSYQNLVDPFGITIAGIATAVEQAKEKSDDVEKKIFKSATSLIGLMMTDTYAMGASQFFQALDDHTGKTMENWMGRMASSFSTPALLREINQDYIDPTVRNTKDHPIVDNVKAGIPGLSNTLPARHDVYGDKIVRENPGYMNVINPSRVTFDGDKVTKEVDKVAEGAITKAPSQINHIKLTAEQQEKYQEKSGRYLKQMLQEDPSWRYVPQDQKKKRVKEILENARNRAKSEMGIGESGHPGDIWGLQ